MSDVFISYAHQDRRIAARLAKALEGENWSVWWDRELVGGQNFRAKIAEALSEARCVVVLWSKASLRSNWVLDEAQDAQRRNVLVPVRFADSLEPPLGFRSFQTLSLAEWLENGSEIDAPCLAPLFKAVRRAVLGTACLDSDSTECRPGETEFDADRASSEPDPAPPAPDAGPSALDRLVRWARSLRPRHLLATKNGLGALVGIVFGVNYLETRLETNLGWHPSWQAHLLDSFRWFERQVDFEFHDLAGSFAVGGFTLSYFGLFPLLAAVVALEFYRAKEMTPLRVLSLSIGVNYAVSLPFFLFLPIRERWADPGSGAMLLSDRLSSMFIENIRPFSGLDNCFPSFHTSLTVALIMLGFLYATRWRWCTLGLGLTIVLSTFALGIHWLPDIIAGASLGVISVCVARRLDLKITALKLDPIRA